MRVRRLLPLLATSLLLSAAGCGNTPYGKVAYVKEVSPGRPAIFSLDLRSGKEIRLTQGEQKYAAPSWSPDGKQIVFAARPPIGDQLESRRLTDSSIYVMSANGMDVRNLTESRPGHNYKTPSWSSDGNSILFIEAGSGVYIMSSDGTEVREVADSGRNPVWSPDGKRIAFDTPDGYVCIINADGTELQSIVKGREPDWSPDGTKIVFAGQDGDIYIIGADGRGRVRLTVDEYLDRWPIWSPDGKKILYCSARFKGEAFSFSMHIIDAEGSGRKELGEGKQPDWL